MAYLIDDPALLRRALDAGWRRIHLKHRLLDEPTARDLHRRGVVYAAWTVNQPADIRRVIQLGADLLITDDPARAMSLLENHRQMRKMRE